MSDEKWTVRSGTADSNLRISGFDRFPDAELGRLVLSEVIFIST